MFRNYLKITVRNIKKHFGYSFLNIAGLAIGMTCSMLILLFVLHERSYDRYHQNAHRIYRVAVRAMLGDTRIAQTWTPAILTPTLLSEYPEVIHSVRFQNFTRGVLVRVGDRVFNENRVTSADAAMFQVFTFRFIQGDPNTALTDPDATVVTASMASKYFGDEDPMGRTLTIGNRDYKIAGVIEDMPENSHFHFDMIISMLSNDGINSTGWFANNYKTYIMLREDCTQEAFEAKLPGFVKKYLWQGRSYDEWADQGNFWEYYLQPLTDIHLNSDLHGEFEGNGNATDHRQHQLHEPVHGPVRRSSPGSGHPQGRRFFPEPADSSVPDRIRSFKPDRPDPGDPKRTTPPAVVPKPGRQETAHASFIG